MHLQWIVHPAITYAITAIGLALCLFLFVSLKRDVAASEARCQKKLAAQQTDWQARMESLDARWREMSQISSLLVPPPPTRSGLNLNKRTQALQMHRRGETPRDIAEALAIPQKEVELLVKVQAIVLSSLEKPAARAAAS